MINYLVDIEKFKELKLRILNGTHTFCCGLAVSAGFETEIQQSIGSVKSRINSIGSIIWI